jgi:2-polyprenyl-3-methyl-5-hydroxy-6-metoxy-1,4-benzoquinol methylase
MNDIEDGHYYKKQVACKSGIIAWSHRSRFEFALKLAGEKPGAVLDYGCGDGTFLAMIEPKASFACGVDIAENQIHECQERFQGRQILFQPINSKIYLIRPDGFDLVTCMETLEHCTEKVIEIVLKDLAALVKNDGRVIVSVPIEIGPTFVLKKIVRTIAAWRGLSDYKFYEKYTIKNALAMIFARSNTNIERPEYGPEGEKSHSHYGFNWKALEKRISAHFRIKSRHFTPLGWSRGFLSSQVWFVCSKK